MSIAELTERVKHYFIITRPEEAKKAGATRHMSAGNNAGRSAKLNRARELAKMAGIDLGI